MMAMILIKTYKKKKESKANYIKFQDKKVNKMKFIKRVISDSGLNEKMVELLEYEFVDRKTTKIYVLDTDEEYLLNSLLLVLDSNELNDSEKVKKIRESVLAIQSSFALELYIPFNAIKTYTEYYVTNYKKEKK